MYTHAAPHIRRYHYWVKGTWTYILYQFSVNPAASPMTSWIHVTSSLPRRVATVYIFANNQKYAYKSLQLQTKMIQISTHLFIWCLWMYTTVTHLCLAIHSAFVAQILEIGINYHTYTLKSKINVTYNKSIIVLTFSPACCLIYTLS